MEDDGLVSSNNDVPTGTTLVTGKNQPRLTHAAFWLNGFAPAGSEELGALRIHDGTAELNCSWQCSGARDWIQVWGYYESTPLQLGTFEVGSDSYYTTIAMGADPECRTPIIDQQFSMTGVLTIDEIERDASSTPHLLRGSLQVGEPKMSGSFVATYCGHVGTN